MRKNSSENVTPGDNQGIPEVKPGPKNHNILPKKRQEPQKNLPPRLFRVKVEVTKERRTSPSIVRTQRITEEKGAPRPPTRGVRLKAAPVRLRRPSRPETYGDKGAPGIYRGCGCAPRATIPEGPTAGIDGEVGV